MGLLISETLYGQLLSNSNYGLKGKMGVTLNHEFSRGEFDFNGLSNEDVDLLQNITNFQISLPLFLNIDTISAKPSLSILKAEYTLRNVENYYTGTPSNEQTLLGEDFYANSINFSYLKSIGLPWMLFNSVRFTYAGDYGDNNPLNINTGSFILRRMNKNLTIGVGLLFQGIEDEYSFIPVPYLDWKINNAWFVDITAPERIIIGRNLGKHKITQVGIATYIEFFTRFAFEDEGQNRIYENFEVSTGLDFRTQLKGKLFLNAFVGNNFIKDVNIFNNNLEEIESVSSNIGLNARIGVSLNLENQ